MNQDMKSLEENSVMDYMTEFIKLVIVRHLDILNNDKNSLAPTYKLDDDHNLQLDNYAEFVCNKVSKMVSQFEEKMKNCNSVEKGKLRIRWTRDASIKDFDFLRGRDGKERWNTLKKSILDNRIFWKTATANPEAHKATEYALTPEFMDIFVETAIRKKQLLNNRDVIRLIKHHDIDIDLLKDVTDIDCVDTDRISPECKKMYDFMIHLSFIKDRMYKEMDSEFYYVFIALKDFVFRKKYVREHGPNKRIYTPFTALDKGARVLFGLNCQGIKELRWIDGVSTYPSLLARLLMMYFPSRKDCKNFLNMVTNREKDFYTRLVEIANEQGLTKKVSNAPANSLECLNYDRKDMKTKFMKYLFGLYGDKELDAIFSMEFPTVHRFVCRFRFCRKVSHPQIEHNAKKLMGYLERKEILSKKFSEVKALLTKYIETISDMDEEKNLQADDNYDGKESRHPHALSYLLEHLETDLFKDVLRRDTTGRVYMLHDSIGFPEREQKKFYEMLCESADRLGWKGFLVHLEFCDRENGTMVTDPNKSRWPRALNLKKLKYNQRNNAKKKVIPKVTEESAGLIEEPIF